MPRPPFAHDADAMPCPACVKSGKSGASKIGNARGTCKMCNKFVSKVRWQTQKAMKAEHEERWQEIYAEREAALYDALTDGDDQ